MQSILIVGVILIVGFIFGEVAAKIKLPKVTGYILAGIFLNPRLFTIVPENFVEHTDVIANLSLAFITFSVGGTLLFSRIQKLGKRIFSITICEAEFAFLIVALGLLAVTPLFFKGTHTSWMLTFIPMSLLLASLASPTDPSATLAVMHEYKAKGDVASTIMGVAAFDDALGIINYSLAVIISAALITHSAPSVHSIVVEPLIIIGGALLLGICFGVVFNKISLLIDRETEGVYIVVIVGLLSLCFGLAQVLGVDELLATMAMGITVVNYNKHSEKIFKMLERYTDELIFIVFFTLSGMHLNFEVLLHSFMLVVCFVVFRAIGKSIGVYVGSHVSNAQPSVRKYTTGGLIPQGGIVVGLALLMKHNPDFNVISDFIINVVIGATVIHELIGPICTKIALRKAGEISKQ